MKQMRMGVLIVFASILAVVLGTTAMASDPDKDLVVKQWEGAPSCDFVDGGVYVDNDSSTYYYKISVTTAVHVPDGSGTRDCAGDPDDCNDPEKKCGGEGTACECSLSGAINTYSPNTQAQINGCALPNCRCSAQGCAGICCIHCDNTSCDPATFYPVYATKNK